MRATRALGLESRMWICLHWLLGRWMISRRCRVWGKEGGRRRRFWRGFLFQSRWRWVLGRKWDRWAVSSSPAGLFDATMICGWCSEEKAYEFLEI